MSLTHWSHARKSARVEVVLRVEEHERLLAGDSGRLDVARRAREGEVEDLVAEGLVDFAHGVAQVGEARGVEPVEPPHEGGRGLLERERELADDLVVPGRGGRGVVLCEWLRFLARFSALKS